MGFPTTRWSRLAIATLNGDTQARAALGEFCQHYREPVRRIICGRGIADPEAEDLTQEFLLHLIQKSALARADRERGRFRSFLQGALANFLADAADRRGAAKRGGGLPHLHLDAWLAGGNGEVHLASAAEELLFDREWALAVMDRALRAVERESELAGEGARFAVLCRFLPVGAEPVSRSEAAKELASARPLSPANCIASAGAFARRFASRWPPQFRPRMRLTGKCATSWRW